MTAPEHDDPLLGRLVVVPSDPERGVGRLVKIDVEDGAPWGRVFFYEAGRFGRFKRDDIVAAPPGVWPRNGLPPTSGDGGVTS